MRCRNAKLACGMRGARQVSELASTAGAFSVLIGVSSYALYQITNRKYEDHKRVQEEERILAEQVNV